MGLPGLEDKSHSPAPDQFDDFELRKGGGEALEGGDL
jgi:hypothetical protein